MLLSDSKATIVTERLVQAENRLVKLVLGVDNEALASEIARVLRDIAAVRMQIEVPSSADKRSSARIHEHASVFVTSSAGQKIEAALHDISAGGALIETDTQIAAGEIYTLQIPGLDNPVSAITRSAREGMTHLAFEGVAAPQVIALVKHIERHFVRY